MSDEELLTVLKKNGMPAGDVLQTIQYIEKHEPYTCFAFCHMYNLGVMAGKRQERAKRRK